MTLSPSVFELISVLSVSDISDPCCLDDGGFLQLDYIGSLLPDVADTTAERLAPHRPPKGSKCFRKTVQALAPVLRASFDFFQSLPASDYAARFGRWVEWTCSPRLVERCCELAKSGDRSSLRLALLLLTACLERSLGDACWRSASDGRSPPPLLKDVLAAPALADVMDATSLCLLRALFGSPSSVNLRNVVWHGFGDPEELPDGLYVAFLLTLVPTLGAYCPALLLPAAASVPGTERRHRPFGCLARVSAHLRDSLTPSSSAVNVADDTRSPLAVATVPAHVRLDFFPAEVRPYAAGSLRLYEQCRWGEFAVLLLPQVEHAMRCLFCTANGCPERMQTAEAAEYYTTWDEILNPTVVFHGDGCRASRPNRLLELLGGKCLDMLRDLLVYPAGPRLRDSLGHMEVDVLSVDAVVAGFTLFVVAELSRSLPTASAAPWADEVCRWRLSRLSSAKDVGRQQQNDTPDVDECYEPLFHPVSLVRKDLLTAVALAESYRVMVGASFASTADATAPWLGVASSGHAAVQGDLPSVKAFAELALSLLEYECPACPETVTAASKCGHRLSEWAKSGFDEDSAAGELRSRLSVALQHGFYPAADAGRTCDVGQHVRSAPGSLPACSVAVFQQTAACLRRVLANLIRFGTARAEQVREGTLRTRQRANYDAYCTWAPALLLLARVCVAVLVERLAGSCCCRSPAVPTVPASDASRLARRREESLLQLAQNMKSHTNFDSNRWAECAATCSKLVRMKLLLTRQSDKGVVS